MSKNISESLTQARINKADEFYTQYADIEKEISAYPLSVWTDKIVYCPCDNPAWSNFWRYFHENFYRLGLRELRATFLQTETETAKYRKRGQSPICIDYVLETGDFRSDECKQIMSESDIIVTNPPFSLFKEFLLQVENFQKEYLIIGNVNSVTNKQIFNLFKDNKLWFGATIHSGDREFRIPDNYPLTATGTRIDNDGTKFVRVKGVRWFTNLEYPNRYRILETDYQDTWPKFDNYNALNISKVKDIPKDYHGVMGVPITFLDKYNPEQFKILGLDITMPDNPRPNKRFIYQGKETYARIMIKSKPLQHADISAFELHKRIFADEPTAAINFDSLYYHPELGYIIVEYLLCEETQTVNPWTSHPNRYWNKNWRKFMSLFNAAKSLNAKLLLINYAKENTKHSDKIKTIVVYDCDKEQGIIQSNEKKWSFEEFKVWYRQLNKECLEAGL